MALGINYCRQNPVAGLEEDSSEVIPEEGEQWKSPNSRQEGQRLSGTCGALRQFDRVFISFGSRVGVMSLNLTIKFRPGAEISQGVRFASTNIPHI